MKNKKIIKRLIIYILAVILICYVTRILFSAAQSIFYNSEPLKIIFSPDGKQQAFIWNKHWNYMLEGHANKSELYAYWGDVSDTSKNKSIQIDRIGLRFKPLGSKPIDISFSPDGIHLAVLTYNCLSVIHLPTEKLWRITKPEDRVSSFRWLNNGEIGYVTLQEGERKSVITVWRQEIKNGPEELRQIYRDEKDSDRKGEADPDYLYPIESWSSGGRYVLFLHHTMKERLSMLDVEEGKVVEFGEPEAYVDYLVGKWASWNHDESEVFCFGGIRGKRDRQWAYLIKTATGEVKDWSEEWTRIMGDKSAYLEEYRTHDNRYIIVNVYGESGSFLFNPRTGIAINPKKQICQMLNMEETDSPRLFYLPKAGWVGVIAIGLNNSTNDWGAPKYAVDYNLNTSVLLFDNHGAWNISFDGKQAAAVFRDRDLPGLVIHKLFENEEL